MISTIQFCRRRFSIKVFTIYELGDVTRISWTNFHFPIPRRIYMKLAFDWPNGFWDVRKCWQRRNLSDLGPTLKNDLDLRHMHIFMCSFSLLLHYRHNSFQEIHFLGVFLCKSIRNQSWPSHRKVIGQPGVIIWINLVHVVLECPMLHTKFQWSRPFGSEEDF